MLLWQLPSLLGAGPAVCMSPLSDATDYRQCRSLFANSNVKFTSVFFLIHNFINPGYPLFVSYIHISRQEDLPVEILGITVLSQMVNLHLLQNVVLCATRYYLRFVRSWEYIALSQQLRARPSAII